MKIKDLKTAALKIINEYSNNGNLISSSTNLDYTLRMNTFINEAQYDVARIRKISATYELPETPDRVTNLYNCYRMPADFMILKGVLQDEYPFSLGIWDDLTLKIPKQYTGTFEVTYYKYPVEITDETSDEYDLTESGFDPEAQTAIPYYVAAMVVDVSPEMPDFTTKFMNQYRAKIGILSPNAEYGAKQVGAYYDM